MPELHGPGTVTGKSVVVTGAVQGIGQAIAARLAAAGARVVVNDVDCPGTTKVAEEIGATAVVGDAASEAGVSALIAAAEEAAGPVDVYFANAGVSGVGGVGASDEDWARSLEVNVMAHVRAARILVPQWLQRGGGRLVVTASAAGLLTMPGAAPYSASKHAAVALAEWLSMTYRDRGVVVQAICPQAVRTAMLHGLGELAEVAERDGTLTPEDVADEVWNALADDRFLVLPHPEVRRFYTHRATDTDRWLETMNAHVRS